MLGDAKKATELADALLVPARTPDGRVVDLRKAPIESGGSVTLLRDITERKRSEERLAEAFDVISSSIRYASRIQRAVLPPAHPRSAPWCGPTSAP